MSNINVYIDAGSQLFQNVVSSIDLSRFNIPQEVMDIVQNSWIRIPRYYNGLDKRSSNKNNRIYNIDANSWNIYSNYFNCTLFYVCR